MHQGSAPQGLNIKQKVCSDEISWACLGRDTKQAHTKTWGDKHTQSSSLETQGSKPGM